MSAPGIASACRTESDRWASANMLELVQTHAIAVFGLQTAENKCREHSEAAEQPKGAVHPVNDLGWNSAKAIGNEQRRCQACGGHAKADRHLLHGARDRARGTGLLLVDVR